MWHEIKKFSTDFTENTEDKSELLKDLSIKKYLSRQLELRRNKQNIKGKKSLFRYEENN